MKTSASTFGTSRQNDGNYIVLHQQYQRCYQCQYNLPLDSYTVLLVRKDLNNNKTLLAQTDEIEFIQGSSYLLVAEKDPDTETGYKIQFAVLKTVS